MTAIRIVYLVYIIQFTIHSFFRGINHSKDVYVFEDSTSNVHEKEINAYS